MNSRFISVNIIIVVALIVFFLPYSSFLSGAITIWHILFLLALAFFYTAFSFIFSHIIWSFIRLFLMAFFILFSFINFAHFKIFDSFMNTGSGFGRLPNWAELHLLIGYWSSVPAILYFLGLVLFIFLVFFEFKIKKSKPRYKTTLFIFSAVVFISLFISLKYIDNPEWYLVSRYHSDLGPIGYFGAELFQRFELTDHKNIQNINEDNLVDVLKKLNVESDYQAYAKPDFASPPNIIFYQLESVAQWAVDLENSPMPFLKNLQQTAISVDDFYGNDCHTVGAEFASACSTLTGSSEVIGNRLEPLAQECLPQLLADNFDYNTSVYHANVVDFWNRNILMPQLGYQNLYFSPLYTPRAYDGLVLDDLVSDQINSNQANLSYFIGYTSHGPHTQHFIDKSLKESNVAITPYAGVLPSVVSSIAVSESEMRNYFGFLSAVDQAIADLFAGLEKNGALDNTIVVIFGDHRYYNFQIDDAQHYQLYNELPFAMYVPGMENIHLPITASHIDVAPTLLDILGIGYDPDKYMGRSILAAESHNYAFGKCGQETFYFTEDTIIRGNQSTDRYLAQSISSNQTIDIKTETLDLISRAASLSDQLWSYQEDFVLPDNALVRSDDDIYIIDRGRRRHIKNEDIFLALGYTWQDIHKFSAEILEQYPLGEPVESIEPQLIKIGYRPEPGASILQPSSGYPYRYYVAHALGSAAGVTGCNCQEAFEESYAKGYRLFEMDLSLTKDKKIVIFHEGDTPLATTVDHKEFMKERYNGFLAVLDLEDILSLMQKYPDAYFITDAKENFMEIHKELVRIIKAKDAQLLDRIIPQIYQESDMEALQALYDFPDIIYTLYITEPSDQSVLDFLARQSGITAITERDRRYNDSFAQKLKERDVFLYVHTVNDKAKIGEMLEKNVGVYTDGL